MTPCIDSRTLLPMDAAVAVNSSAFAKVAYDQERTILQVEFRDGAVWHYLGVPFQTYQDLLRADSKGAYFNQHIRNLFPQHPSPAAHPPKANGQVPDANSL